MTITTRVVNINYLPGKTIPANSQYVYVGRAGRGYDGYFGNPVIVGRPCPECGRTHGRGQTLSCYEKYLWRRLRTDPEFRERVRSLEGKTLVCFCKPGPCHGDVLSRVADELASGESPEDNKESPLDSRGNKEEEMSNLNAQVEMFSELLDAPIEKLQAQAKELGVEMQNKDKAELIEAIVEASMNGAETKAQQEIQPGVLLALHSRTEDAKELIRQANERIIMNQHMSPPRLFRLLLRNKDGELYSRTVPGVRVSKERLPSVMRLVTLPDGAQNEEFNRFKKNPEAYEQPVLVRVARRNKDGSVRSYVMLYLRRKSTGASEQVF